MKIDLKLSRTTYRMIACTLLLIAGGLYYFNREEPPPPPPAQEAKADTGANITFSGSTIVEQENGKKLWEMTAETMQVNNATNKVQLGNFKGTMYRKDGSKLDIVARQAEIDTKTKDIAMEGDIKATSSSDGAVFMAAKANWAGKDRKLFGSGGITLTRGDTVATGDAIEGEELLERVKIKGNARIIKGGNPQ